MSALSLIVFALAPEGSLNYSAVVVVSLLFCVKVIFSSTIVAIALSICLLNYIHLGEFSFFDILNQVCSMLTWKLSEDIRSAMTRVYFIWLLSSPLTGRLTDKITIV
jgi:hypothetical protein